MLEAGTTQLHSELFLKRLSLRASSKGGGSWWSVAPSSSTKGLKGVEVMLRLTPQYM